MASPLRRILRQHGLRRRRERLLVPLQNKALVGAAAAHIQCAVCTQLVEEAWEARGCTALYRNPPPLPLPTSCPVRQVF